jgi:D-arabinose 1-dehydrogenase-like Zn-dependent alcohol dehydrogenase
MGSHRELQDATSFISEHKVVPVVSAVLDGLDSYEEGFEMMKKSSQFGKIVIRLRRDNKGRL